MHYQIENPNDPRLDPFRHLKDTNATRWQRRFVAEGDKLVERLLASGLPVESLLVSQRHLERFAGLAVASGADVPLWVVPDAWIEQIVGFNFHRGVLASAPRPPARKAADIPVADGRPATWVVCPDVQDPENLGTILRNSAAFGVDAVLLGPRAADPFSRRVLRVSMGAPFRLPIAISNSLATDLTELAQQRHFDLWATVLDPAAQQLCQLDRPQRLALVFGSEGHGLDEATRRHCTRAVTIPMQPGTDSLNVAVASGIFLYVVTRLPAGKNNTTPT